MRLGGVFFTLFAMINLGGPSNSGELKSKNIIKEYQFVLIDELLDWKPCIDCETLDVDGKRFAGGVSKKDADEFLSWYSKKIGRKARLLSLNEYQEAYGTRSLPVATRKMKTWLSDCRIDASFHTPSADERKIWNLPDDWPYKIDENGRVCETEKCLVCSVAWTDDTGVQTQELFELSSPSIIGLLTRIE